MSRTLCFIILLINVGLNINLKAKPFSTFKQIPNTFNIDSLEFEINRFNQKDIEYINCLITIEKNRGIIGSGLRDKYKIQIDTLSNKVNYKFGVLFSKYLKARSEFKQNINSDFKQAIRLSEDLLKEAAISNDTICFFYAELLLVRSYTNLIPGLLKFDNKNMIIATQQLKSNIETHLKLAKYLSKKCGYFYEFNFNINNLDLIQNTFKSKADYGNTEDIAQRTFELIHTHKDLAHFESDVHEKLGHFYTLSDSILKGISQYKKAYSFQRHKESSSNYLLPQNLGSNYFIIGQLDSAYKYLKIAANLVEDTMLYRHKNSENLYSILAYTAEDKGLKDEAIRYYSKTIQGFFLKNAKLMAGAIKSQDDYEQQKENEFNLKLAQAERKQTIQLLWLIITLAFLLIIIITIVLIAYKKTKIKNNEIRNLQLIRDKFYTIVAHDLRSPLNSYQDMAETLGNLLKNNQYDQIEQIACQIDTTGIKLRNMLKNLFEWSSLQLNSKNILEESFDLNTILRELYPIYKQMAINKNITIKSEIKIPVIITTDKNILLTIIRNLLDNAIKYSNPFSTVTIEATQLNYTSIKISNEAVIPQDKFEYLNQFFLNQNSLNFKNENSGLGLILIKEFMAKIEGKITVDYNENRLYFNLILNDKTQ